MDAARFDDVVRSLSHNLSRRAAALGIGGVLGLSLVEGDAKKKKKKGKKSKCAAPCRKCKKGKCKSTGEGLACGPCSECQNGACISFCGTGEQCLANSSFGKTCDNDGQCPTSVGSCSCNEDDGGDPVCRVSIGGGDCIPLSDCETTADCPQGTVCSTICDPSKCVPLCDVSTI